MGKYIINRSSSKDLIDAVAGFKAFVADFKDKHKNFTYEVTLDNPNKEEWIAIIKTGKDEEQTHNKTFEGVT